MRDGRPHSIDPRWEIVRTLDVAAVELDIRVGDIDHNVECIRDGVARGVAAGARLIVLPELATSGYVFEDACEARSLALTADDRRLIAVASQLPDGTVGVVGFCELAGDRLFNSALVITRDRILARYRKAHLWAAETEIFSRGSEAGAIVDTPIGRIGVALCYDNEFPEVPRRLALSGAEILALPVNWPLVPRPPRERAPETIQAMAAARSSRLAMVIADRHGHERGVAWTGGSAVISPDGWVCAEADDRAAIVHALLDLPEPGDKALGDYNDLFGDRRPDTYALTPTPHSPARSTL